jgi:uncharacterized protein YdbL (DUF1318 family)
MKSFVVFRLLFVAAALAFGTVTVRAQDLNAVKARIEQRLGSVNALKDRGVAGENNRGFLEVRGNGSAEDQKVISEENADRRAVYNALAAQTGATSEAVGRQRAQQIASIARAGHWIQDAGGGWKQKG